MRFCFLFAVFSCWLFDVGCWFLLAVGLSLAVRQKTEDRRLTYRPNAHTGDAASAFRAVPPLGGSDIRGNIKNGFRITVRNPA